MELMNVVVDLNLICIEIWNQDKFHQCSSGQSHIPPAPAIALGGFRSVEVPLMNLSSDVLLLLRFSLRLPPAFPRVLLHLSSLQYWVVLRNTFSFRLLPLVVFVLECTLVTRIVLIL